MRQSKMKNIFKICGAVYETSWFGQRFKRSSGTEIWKIVETAKTENIFETRA